MHADEVKAALDAELERRLERLAAEGDDAFGRFSGGDWAVVLVLFLLIPSIAVWWFAP